MSELFRDTIVGKILRLASRGKLYPFAEEKDPSLWRRYIHHNKTQEIATYGRLLEGHEKSKASNGNPDIEKEADRPADNISQPVHTSHESSTTRVSGENDHVGEPHKTNAVGQIVDPEKGKDTNVVEWYGSDDPEVGKILSSFSSA